MRKTFSKTLEKINPLFEFNQKTSITINSKLADLMQTVKYELYFTKE